ncbi:peptidoglycan editing factor PgeF [Marinivivus vitaminiproducens]|nr:peptidoglycan editing factor PgeF [Geminicoccaceae bacterium SCSIO 64248]
MRAAALEGLAGIAHGFFTRKGGLSTGAFASLNCGLSGGDRPEAVRANRARVAACLGCAPDALVSLHQVHGRAVVRADAPWPLDSRPQADGLVTTRPGLALGVLAADCGPILLADPEAGVIGAAHAGWRGALSGIAEATVAAMVAAGARAGRITAVLGPCIAQKSYEVGDGFRDAFLAEDPASARFFSTPCATGRPHFDLKACILERLARAGVGKAEALPFDTYADPARFFSYRRTTHEGGGPFGIAIAAIALRPEG